MPAILPLSSIRPTFLPFLPSFLLATKMSSPQLIVINACWGGSNYSYGELINNYFIQPGTDRDIRIDDCTKVDPSPEWSAYMDSILKALMIVQSDGKCKEIKGPVKFLNMIKIRSTGYLMPEIQLQEPQDTHYVLQYMSHMARQPKQCIAPPKPKEVYVFPPVPTVKRVHMACPTPAKPAVPVQVVRKRRDSCDSTRATRADLNSISAQKGKRGRSDSCDSTGAVRDFDA